MRPLLALLAASLGVVAVAAPARAADAPAQPVATSPATTPAPKPTPAGGKLTLSWIEPIVLRGRAMGLAGRSLKVRGRVSRYVRGQTVVVRAYRDGRRFFSKRVRVTGVGKGRGGFKLRVTPKRSGRIGIAAVHERTATQQRMVARPLRLTAHSPFVSYGARNAVVDLVQRQLRREHYAINRTRRFDGSTARALLAFRKVNGFRRTGTLNRTILRMLIDGRGAFRPKYPGHGYHVEADISRQVLALVNPRGRVFRVYHTSSGAPSTPTVLGTYRFYRKDFGTNSHGMVHSSYFIRGYAIHGYRSVPVWNASHGCLRVPIPSAYSIFRWVKLGQRIDVYR
jgi:L,D-transpeptidase catalytic domain